MLGLNCQSVLIVAGPIDFLMESFIRLEKRLCSFARYCCNWCLSRPLQARHGDGSRRYDYRLLRCRDETKI